MFVHWCIQCGIGIAKSFDGVLISVLRTDAAEYTPRLSLLICLCHYAVSLTPCIFRRSQIRTIKKLSWWLLFISLISSKASTRKALPVFEIARGCCMSWKCALRYCEVKPRVQVINVWDFHFWLCSKRSLTINVLDKKLLYFFVWLLGFRLINIVLLTR